ncbi:MAG: AbrB/MazE/SpoVT family DNA-binding domain-containing protein [Oscillospiraceae bacterium]|nr:AbrB/MazE/SpoVT family DNA-binding domain-containing protein [Oscillospiraceae bacterium]
MKGKHIYAHPGGKHIFGTVKVGAKGQIVIPKEAREYYKISEGDTLLVIGDERGIIVSTPDVIKDVADNIFKGMEYDE